MKKIALVFCKVLPEPDPDQELTVDALKAAGLDAEWAAWDDPDVDWGSYDLCIIRSCWNYFEDPDRFLNWVDRTAEQSRVLNSPRVVHWNIHKRYLNVLEKNGVPAVPTKWAPRGEETNLKYLGWDDVVIKPAIGAGSVNTRRFQLEEFKEAQGFLDSQVQDKEMMIQPYLRSVEHGGERALIWIDGELTHCVVKTPRFSGQDEKVSEAVAVTNQEKELADRALACVPGDLLYARVDVMEDENKNPLVSELELMEPSLFFLQYPKALSRFVEGIVNGFGQR